MKKAISLLMAIIFVFSLVSCGNSTVTTGINCKKCGTEVQIGALFCSNCGAALNNEMSKTNTETASIDHHKTDGGEEIESKKIIRRLNEDAFKGISRNDAAQSLTDMGVSYRFEYITTWDESLDGVVSHINISEVYADTVVPIYVYRYDNLESNGDEGKIIRTLNGDDFIGITRNDAAKKLTDMGVFYRFEYVPTWDKSLDGTVSNVGPVKVYSNTVVTVYIHRYQEDDGNDEEDVPTLYARDFIGMTKENAMEEFSKIRIPFHFEHIATENKSLWGTVSHIEPSEFNADSVVTIYIYG